jgi:hypothetical protein
MLKRPPRVDELNHHARLILGQRAGTLGQIEIQIDPILRNVQTPIARLIGRHRPNLPGPAQQMLKATIAATASPYGLGLATTVAFWLNPQVA